MWKSSKAKKKILGKKKGLGDCRFIRAHHKNGQLEPNAPAETVKRNKKIE